MARPYRLQGENCLYHITSRGDDRKKIFLDGTDYRKFLEYVLFAKERFSFHFFAYCLMPNHYHLLIETTQPNISAVMQYINTSYTAYYNIKRNRCGHLFQGRYKSILVDADVYFLELTRYIHLNPVKAKIVTTPSEYQWSSYKGYLTKKGDRIIDHNQIERYLNLTTEQYREFVAEGIGKELDPFKNVYAGFLLGSGDFIKEKLENLKGRVKGKEISHKKELSKQVNEREIIETVAKHYHMSSEELCRTKKRSATEKKIAIYLIKRLTALTNNRIGKIFGLSFSAVSKVTKGVVVFMDKDKEVRQMVEGVISTFKA